MPAGTYSTPEVCGALILVVTEALTFVAAQRFRVIFGNPEGAPDAQGNLFWGSAIKSGKDCCGQVSQLVFHPFCRYYIWICDQGLQWECHGIGCYYCFNIPIGRFQFQGVQFFALFDCDVGMMILGGDDPLPFQVWFEDH